MKRLVALAAIVLAGCTAPTSSLPTPTAAATPSGTPAVLAVVVDARAATDHNHTIYLVGLDGKAIASARASDPTPISSWPAASPIATLWSTRASASDSRVYYLDGDNAVRFLGRDGTTGEVTHIPGDASTRSYFAVSPDDGQIAVSVLDYSAPPIVHMQFYVQDLRSGAKNPVPTATDTYFWPVGWHAGKVVVQRGQAIPQTLYGAYPESAVDFMLIDPTGGGTVTIGGPTCLPQPSLATPAGIVCVDPREATFKVVGWDGKEVGLSGPLGTDGASLSTDGRWVATSDSDGILLRSFGTSTKRAPTAAGFPGEAGWIDSTHLVYRVSGSTKEAIYDTAAGATTLIAVDGTLVARLPGGL